jgi:Protein of unknown function (DUF1638)
LPTDMVLGVIGCPILEDEIVYAVSRDKSIRKVIAVRTDDSANLVRKLNVLKERPLIELIEPGTISSVEEHEFALLVLMQPMALHEDPQVLRQEVSKTIAEVARVSRSILLFYGLCGNAFKDMGPLMETANIPITVLSDGEGRPVDDCIAAVLGGTDGYLRLLKRYPGVFYLTPAWAENWRELMSKMEITRGLDREDLSTIRWMFELAGYKLALKIPTGLGDQDLFDSRVAEFAQVFNFERGELEKEHITLDCVDRSYERAKALLKGEE